MHRFQQAFHLKAVKQRNRVIPIGLYALCVTRHHHPHDFFGGLIGVVALDKDFFYFA